MTASAKHHLHRTFSLLEPRAGVTALVFYQRLFTREPSLRTLFLGDIETQGHKLMQMLRVIMESLESPEALVPMLEEMGARHAGYGVRDAHYEIVGTALLESFAEMLGPEFNAEARAAWTAAYALIAETMQRGAHHAGAAATP